MSGCTYRVAQWGTGHAGAHALRKIIEHPRYELVGAYVYSHAKVGKDAGDLCGVGPTGIIVTNDIDQLIATKPDCVIYMPMMDLHSIDDMCRLLESGANIVTTAMYFHHPASMNPDERKQLEAACKRGNTSLYDTGGGSPGFIVEAFPLTALLMERRLDRYSVLKNVDMSARKSPEMNRELFGMGPDDVNITGILDRHAKTDCAGLKQLADAIGTPLDDMKLSATVAMATKRVQLVGVTVEPGTVAAWRFEATGIRAGKPYLTFARTMWVTKDLDPAWEIEGSGWHLIIEGDAPMNIVIDFPPPEIYLPLSGNFMSNVPVNAVLALCQYDGEPGIRTTDELRLVPIFG